MAVWDLTAGRRGARYVAGPMVAARRGTRCVAAVLTRPNLVPLAIVFVPILVSYRPFARRLAWFALGVAPGCVAVAVLNHHLYGSPMRSRYGSLPGL